jgi:hypothetical protein
MHAADAALTGRAGKRRPSPARGRGVMTIDVKEIKD